MAGDAHYRVLIVGGGTAGISVAARLSRTLPAGSVAIIEPAEWHYYQPLWTLVGGGEARREDSRRPMASLIPPGVDWKRASVTEFHPDSQAVETSTGDRIAYDFLVVAAGLQIDWAKVEGLPAALGREGVVSNYSYDTTHLTWEFIDRFDGGPAIFTHPATPVKCAGAPQKIMYLADDAFRRNGVRDRSEIHFYSGEPLIFKVAKYADRLMQVIARKDIRTHFRHSLTALRPSSREAVFQDLEAKREVVQRYSLIHVTPPMSALDVIKRSPLGDAAGWVEVNRQTLRHARFPSVFSLGDCSNLPTSKTGAAIRKQVPVLVANLLAAIAGEDGAAARYDGYTSCPLVTGYDRLVLAEFDYDLKPCETFPFDQSVERTSMYLLKKHALPAMYWHGMLRGRL